MATMSVVATVLVLGILSSVHLGEADHGSSPSSQEPTLTQFISPGDSYIYEQHSQRLRSQYGFFWTSEGANLTVECTLEIPPRNGHNCRKNSLHFAGATESPEYCGTHNSEDPIFFEAFAPFVQIYLDMDRRGREIDEVDFRHRPHGSHGRHRFNCTITATESACSAPKCSTLCGQKNTARIVGGDDAQDCEYPWQATIIKETADGLFICGGTIISEKTILTAAHCVIHNDLVVHHSDLLVFVGHYTLDDILAGLGRTGEFYHAVSNVIVNEEYQQLTRFDSDIALLEVSTPIELDYCRQPACLPFYDSSFRIPSPGESVTIIGFGVTTYPDPADLAEILQEVTVPMIDHSECKDRYATIGGVVTDNMICAASFYKGSCFGDSGGPLASNANGAEYIYGVTSWTAGCQTNIVEDSPGWFSGVYVDVTKFLDWIEANSPDGTDYCHM